MAVPSCSYLASHHLQHPSYTEKLGAEKVGCTDRSFTPLIASASGPERLLRVEPRTSEP